MSNPTFAVTEIVGSSQKSVGEAIENGIATAAKSLRHLDWFEVVSTRGEIAESKVNRFQVTIKLGFRYED